MDISHYIPPTLDYLPLETLSRIASYLDIRSAQCLALVSRSCLLPARHRLWRDQDTRCNQNWGMEPRSDIHIYDYDSDGYHEGLRTRTQYKKRKSHIQRRILRLNEPSIGRYIRSLTINTYSQSNLTVWLLESLRNTLTDLTIVSESRRRGDSAVCQYLPWLLSERFDAPDSFPALSTLTLDLGLDDRITHYSTLLRAASNIRLLNVKLDMGEGCEEEDFATCECCDQSLVTILSESDMTFPRLRTVDLQIRIDRWDTPLPPIDILLDRCPNLDKVHLSIVYVGVSQLEVLDQKLFERTSSLIASLDLACVFKKGDYHTLRYWRVDLQSNLLRDFCNLWSFAGPIRPVLAVTEPHFEVSHIRAVRKHADLTGYGVLGRDQTRQTRTCTFPLVRISQRWKGADRLQLASVSTDPSRYGI